MANFVVNTTADIVSATDKRTSLREAIQTSNAVAGNDTISFGALSGAINLTKSLEVTSNIVLTGNGKISIFGKSTFDVIAVSKAASFNVSRLTIGRGLDGIDVKDGNRVTISDVILSNNADDGLDIGGKNNIINANKLTAKLSVEDGIEIDGANNTVNINNSVLTANSQGLHTDIGGDGNRITVASTSLISNKDDGADFDSNTNIVVFRNNKFNNNVDDGISIDLDRNKFTFTGNAFTANKDNGIELKGKNNLLTGTLPKTNTFIGNKKAISNLSTGNIITNLPSIPFSSGISRGESIASEITRIITPVAVDY